MDQVTFSIDRGGTFTDVYASTGSQQVALKLLSEDPKNYEDAPREGIRRVLEMFYGLKIPRSERIDTSRIKMIRMGTTVATNALLERKGEKFALVTTKGFKDIWHIGNQSRPDIFDLSITCPENLYDSVVELDERVILAHEFKRQGVAVDIFDSPVTGEPLSIRTPLDLDQVRSKLKRLKEVEGITSIAVVLMHASLYPEHELAIGRIAKEEFGFGQISLSHQVMQMVKIVPRGYTTSADAYLTPHITRYIQTFVSGFDENLLKTTQILFMQSDGGLTDISQFSGHRAILSGPAGGVVGYALTSHLAYGTSNDQVVGFDMGGTSTDVSRYSGTFEHVFETTTAGITIQAPQLDIHTVAAGGGSKLTIRNGVFHVGPESVGAHPGPVCYRKGGDLAITDANLVLGRLIPEYFPHIFGETEDQPLDKDASQNAFEKLCSETGGMSVEAIAHGFIKVANETMCRPIRNLTQMKGFDITKHTLACFGGAGGQHACAIARSLGMKKVFIHRFSGILSAYGIGLADVVEDEQEPCATRLSCGGPIPCEMAPEISHSFQTLEKTVRDKLIAQGFSQEQIEYKYYLNIRFHGTDTALMTRSLQKDDLAAFVDTFTKEYQREFGFVFTTRDLIVDDVRVRGSGRSSARFETEKESKTTKERVQCEPKNVPKESMLETRKVFFEDRWMDTSVYKLSVLRELASADQHVSFLGPAIILDNNSTIVVEPECVAFVSREGDVSIELHQKSKVFSKTTEVDPIQLALFSNRFMGIAEQMGRTLQRTAVSVNIKERLDFSCALFGPDGGLVANAPHIPVHLGAMQEAIRFQYNMYKDKAIDDDEHLQDGDVLVSNHPQLAGGSHLPDITVITPCFGGRDNKEIIFWVASRGHHADIGGISPGSMPPHSQSIVDEGAAIVSFKLVRHNEFQEQGISQILLTPSNPNDPNCSGTRGLEDNLSDLKAQVAANNRGIRLVRELVTECSLEVVQAYMHYIQENAALAVRNMLKTFVARIGTTHVKASDFMDDGTEICVSIDIDPETGNAKFDFEGTGPQVLGNCNAPPAVTYSAVIYCLRCLVGETIPLNQGCLQPVTVNIPPNTILNPSKDSAVVGGNVLTSQRVVDVILKAFRAAAASQGCMNNLTFGDQSFGYYETIAGGAGAGPSWDGRSGVHTHMTNTRITDPEIFERRYPVILRQFGLRAHSGGEGLHRGGDGVIREIEFLRPVHVSILSERRAFAPFGLEGGEPAKMGQNLLIRADTGILQNMGGKNTAKVKNGDRILIKTPGGGGFGQKQQ